MTPKRDTSKKHHEILDAAVREFQAVGYENTSMDRIAETAGASKRTVYNHFASKESLFHAAFDRLKDELQELKRVSYDPERELAEQLGEFVDAKRAVAENPAWLGLMKVATAVFIANPEMARETMARLTEEEDRLVLWLRDATADGRMNVEDPARAAHVFWAMVSGGFYWPSLYFGPLDEKTSAPLKEDMLALFLARYGKD
jgi:TetR/AcrR family transcriptional regulator, regulator of autoinduction and epiphytic fitness